jgi:hypothetical protein
VDAMAGQSIRLRYEPASRSHYLEEISEVIQSTKSHRELIQALLAVVVDESVEPNQPKPKSLIHRVIEADI